MTITIINDEWQQFVLSLHQLIEQNTPTTTKQLHKFNTLHVNNWTCVKCVRRSTGSLDEDAMHRRCCRWTIAVVAAMPRQSLVSVRHLRRKFDDGRPSAEGQPRRAVLLQRPLDSNGHISLRCRAASLGQRLCHSSTDCLHSRLILWFC